MERNGRSHGVWMLQAFWWPGLVVHELAHALAVKLIGGTIVEADFVDGYVHWEAPPETKLWEYTVIQFAPLAVNFLIATGLFILSGYFGTVIQVLLIALGVSVFGNMAPSLQDVTWILKRGWRNLKDHAGRSGIDILYAIAVGVFLAVVVLPLAVVSAIGHVIILRGVIFITLGLFWYAGLISMGLA